MNSIERVLMLCAERKVSVAKLERDCEFGNGYIKALRKGVIPEERLEKIAKYFGVSKEYLRTGEAPIEDDYEVSELRQIMRERPEVAFLMNLAKNGRTSDILEASALLQRYKEESENK